MPLPTSSEFGRIAQALTRPHDRIAAYTFKAKEYLLAKRLPAASDFFYLPMQKLYFERPILGVSKNVCDELRRVRPKIMYIDQWSIDEKHPWTGYGACIQEFATEQYVNIGGKPYYVRKDVFDANAASFVPAPVTFELVASGQTKELLSGERPLDQVAVRLNAMNRRGRIEFNFSGPMGSVSRTVVLHAVPSGTYHAIPLDGRPYDRMTVTFATDGGGALAHSAAGLPCMVYGFSRQTDQVTPGCPLLD